jgi:hypothetical protein
MPVKKRKIAGMGLICCYNGHFQKHFPGKSRFMYKHSYCKDYIGYIQKAGSSFMVCGLCSNFITWPRQILLETP